MRRALSHEVCASQSSVRRSIVNQSEFDFLLIVTLRFEIRCPFFLLDEILFAEVCRRVDTYALTLLVVVHCIVHTRFVRVFLLF